MKKIFKHLILLALILGALTAPNAIKNDAQSCSEEDCVLPNCRCSSTNIPNNLDSKKIPQFVHLTFDDAVTDLNVETYYKQIFNDKKNPDGCQITGTFFMSHEYTDYSKVHELYELGHELSLHSISHSPNTSYWQNLDVEGLEREFVDQKTIITYFANVPDDAIKGLRMPYLQLAGSNSFKVLKEAGLTYDCSWPTQNFIKPGLWPYTLDYLSNQDCVIGPCPKESVPGVWVAPMIDWTDLEGVVCAMPDSCVNIPDEEDQLLQWFIDNFNIQYNGNRAPFGVYIHAAWFDVNPIHFPAYLKFIDYLLTLDDVYLVGVSSTVDWIQNPVELGTGDWNTCRTVENLDCYSQSCKVYKNEEVRYITVCTEDCPEVYPWSGNPYGESNVTYWRNGS